MSSDAAAETFRGEVVNTTSATVTQVRVEIHLSNGVELGPTPRVDQATAGVAVRPSRSTAKGTRAGQDLRAEEELPHGSPNGSFRASAGHWKLPHRDNRDVARKPPHPGVVGIDRLRAATLRHGYDLPVRLHARPRSVRTGLLVAPIQCFPRRRRRLDRIGGAKLLDAEVSPYRMQDGQQLGPGALLTCREYRACPTSSPTRIRCSNCRRKARPVPARPQWLLAIPDAIRQLEALDRELLTRRDIEQLFGSRGRARRS